MKISSRFTLILVDHQNLVRIKYPISRKLIEEQIPSLLSCIPQSRFAAKWTLVFTLKMVWVFNIRLFLNFSSPNFSKETLKEVQPMARAYMSNFLLHLILHVALFFLLQPFDISQFLMFYHLLPLFILRHLLQFSLRQLQHLHL